MRTIVYAIINKETSKKVFWSIDKSIVEKELAAMKDKAQYTIGSKWCSL